MKSNYFDQLIFPNHLNDLKYLEANKNYTILHFSNGEKKESGYNLLRFEKLLSANPTFKRTHRSYLLNTDYIESVNERACYLKLTSKEVLPITKGQSPENFHIGLN